MTKQIIFVDSAVPDYQTLIESADTAQVFILNENLSGVEQITNTLALQSDIEAIHILSHGSPGTLHLGSETLSNQNLPQLGNKIKQWGKALTKNADILLYGCNVAAKETGLQFIQKLHQLTGANIAASNNKTGNQALGGDWELFVKIGQISTPLALTSAAMASYQGILGPTLFKDINPGTNGSDPRNFINLNNTLYFTADDGTNGNELWKSDGTSAGTVLLKDIYPGTNGSFPRNFFNFNNTLYFTAGDATNGYELWKSDGTSAGTVLLKDIYPGTDGSDPYNFINLNNTLYFTADDGTNGEELWSLAPATITNVTATTADGTYGIGATINITATFSEAVTITGTPQLQLETGTTDQLANYTTGSGTPTLTFNYTVQPGDTTLDLQYLTTTALALNGGAIKDSVNIDADLNLPALASLESLGGSKALVIDGIAPTVTSITRKTPTATLTNSNSVIYTVSFSEPVKNLDIGDFTLNKTGTVNGNIASVSAATGTTIDVTVNSITGDGNLGLDVPATATINDIPGNALTAAFTTGQTYTVDTTPPTVTINQATAQTDPTATSPINFTVTFSEPVTDFDATDIDLSTSTATGTLTPTITGGGPVYTVAVNGMTGSGNVIASIKANGVTDPVGNNNTVSTSTDNSVTYNAPAPEIQVLDGATDIADGTISTTGGVTKRSTK